MGCVGSRGWSGRRLSPRSRRTDGTSWCVSCGLEGMAPTWPAPSRQRRSRLGMEGCQTSWQCVLICHFTRTWLPPFRIQGTLLLTHKEVARGLETVGWKPGWALNMGHLFSAAKFCWEQKPLISGTQTLASVHSGSVIISLWVGVQFLPSGFKD